MHDHTVEEFRPCAQCEEALETRAASTIITTQCGHTMHRYCFKEMKQTNTPCRQCEKEAEENKLLIDQNNFSKSGPT